MLWALLFKTQKRLARFVTEEEPFGDCRRPFITTGM